MPDAAHHVVFRFDVPPELARRKPDASWKGAPRGCTLILAPGAATATSLDHSETFARKQVLNTAAEWLRAVAGADSVLLRGHLSAPSCRARSEVYSIAVGAAVSIARIDPHGGPVVTLDRARQLQLV